MPLSKNETERLSKVLAACAVQHPAANADQLPGEAPLGARQTSTTSSFFSDSSSESAVKDAAKDPDVSSVLPSADSAQGLAASAEPQDQSKAQNLPTEQEKAPATL